MNLPPRSRPSARSAAGRSTPASSSSTASPGSRAAAVRAGVTKPSAASANSPSAAASAVRTPPPVAVTKKSSASARAGSVKTSEVKQPSGRRVAADDAGSVAVRHSERARAQPQGSKRPLMVIAGGLILVVGLGVIGALAWGPFQRSRQLAAIDASRDTGNLAMGRQLAAAFAQEWGPRSPFVIAAITEGHGSLEARIDWCRLGHHLALLLPLVDRSELTTAQRGLLCGALAELWNSDDGDAKLPRSVSLWALDPATEAELAEPALKLLVAASGAEAAGQLALALVQSRLSPERLSAVTAALCVVVERQGKGVAALLTAMNGPQREKLLGSAEFAHCVGDNAQPMDAANLLGLLAKPDSQAIALAGLGGKRFVVSDSDSKARATVTAQLLPFLSAATPDAAVSGALVVCHRQHLLGAHGAIIALLPRLGKTPPAQISADDVADLLGKTLVTTKTPEAALVAETMVVALSKAVSQPDTKALAIRALSRVQYQNIAALRPALAVLAEQGPEGATALNLLVGKVYSRDDIVKAAQSRGWTSVLVDDQRKRTRFDTITRWLSDHADETNARISRTVLAENKAELSRQRDELNTWVESKQPLPIGIAKRDLEQLSDSVRTMLSSVIKATH